VIAKVYKLTGGRWSRPVFDRGGDFLIPLWRFHVGYRAHNDKAVHLFCVETTLRSY